MKICIPTIGDNVMNDHVGEHFGRVPTYTIVNLDTNEVKVIQNTSEHMGGTGYPPEIMAREGVNIMVCRGLGRRAITMFEDMGIEVYIGAFGTVKDAIEDFKQGRLQKAGLSDACGQHAFRDRHYHGNQSGHCQK